MVRKHTAVINSDGVTLAVYCLKTDSWNDYLAFMDDAEAATKQGKVRDVNRLLRAALTCLFSHVEGVVNEIYDQKLIAERRQSLCQKAHAVALAAACEAPIPFVDFRLEKQLRDLIAHPGITKAFSDPASTKTRLDQDGVFQRLSIDTLKRLEQRITPWLDAVCFALKVERFTDTKREIEKFIPILSALGQVKIAEV